MTDIISAEATREALATLPEETSHGESPEPERVYLPPSHVKAMDPNTLLVTGMRGAGKTFWWSALQDRGVRQLVGQQSKPPKLSEDTEIRTGFGVIPKLNEYPSKDVLRDLMEGGVEPRTIWRTVQAWQLADNDHDHPLRRRTSWADRVKYVVSDPEAIERLFQERDAEFDQKSVYFLMLFDALDRCSDEWKGMYRAIRGLLQTALDMRPYRRLRVKVFLRSDQVNEAEIADFPDASKVLSSAVELSWPRRDLYALLWHVLGNGQHGDRLRTFLGDEWKTVEIDPADGKYMFTVPRQLFDEDHQRERFHHMTGPWMGTGRRRGFPYTWIPNHLGDTDRRVSPRSFLAALRKAAEDTTSQHPDHEFALHYNSIKSGVQEASKIRVNEIREDYPWVDRVLDPLRGMVVPCEFNEIEERWKKSKVLDHLAEQVEGNEVKLPPSHIDEGAAGVRRDIESLGVFLRMRDGRINIPDVFRVGYGLGRRGGVRPVR